MLCSVRESTQLARFTAAEVKPNFNATESRGFTTEARRATSHLEVSFVKMILVVGFAIAFLLVLLKYYNIDCINLRLLYNDKT